MKGTVIKVFFEYLFGCNINLLVHLSGHGHSQGDAMPNFFADSKRPL